MNSMPPFLKQFENFTGAGLRTGLTLAEGKTPFVSQEEAEYRWEICQTCKYLEGTRCLKCGCSMKVKSKLSTEWCLEGKWSVPGLVSVLVPHRNEKPKYLESTLKNIKETAVADIEVIHLEDKGVGNRVIRNQLAAKARGEYLFFLDAHCALSPSWDTQLKVSLEGRKDLVFCVLSNIKPDWTPGKAGHYKVELNDKLVEKWNGGPVSGVVESMAFTGCGWMIRQDRFWELGGYDKQLAGYGGDGPEWALKVWLSGGRVLLNSDVWCGHVWNTNANNSQYKVDTKGVDETYELIRRKTFNQEWPLQYRPISWLAGHFGVDRWLGLPLQESHSTVTNDHKVERLTNIEGPDLPRTPIVSEVWHHQDGMVVTANTDGAHIL